MTAPLLSVTDVHAGYLPGVDILRGLSLEARRERDHAGDRTERRRQVDAAAHRVRVPDPQPGQHHVRATRPTAGLRPSDLKAAGISYVTQDINSFPSAHGGGQPAHGRMGVPPRRRATAAPARARLCDVSGARRQAARARRRAVRRPGPHAVGRARADDRAATAAGRRADRGARAQSGRAGLRHPARPRRRRAGSRSCWSSRTSSRRCRSPIISISSISAG